MTFRLTKLKIQYKNRDSTGEIKKELLTTLGDKCQKQKVIVRLLFKNFFVVILHSSKSPYR